MEKIEWIVSTVIILLFSYLFFIIIPSLSETNKVKTKNNVLCVEYCIENNWTYGRWIGSNNCECSDRIIYKNNEIQNTKQRGSQ